LTKNVNNEQQVGGNSGGPGKGNPGGANPYQTTLNDQIENNIEEQNAEFETQARLGEFHQLKWILGWNRQGTNYVEDSLNINVHSVTNDLNSVNFRMNDNWAITHKLNVDAGFLYEKILKYNKSYWQPRMSIKYALHKDFNISFSYGIYNQFVTQLPQIDDFNHIRYFWMVSDFDKISVQRGIHKVLAFNYQVKGLKLDVNVFQLNTTGLTRFRDYEYNSAVYNGESHSTGFDMLLSTTFKNLNFWATYTYSKTLEHFDYFTTNEFVRALHDQRHELKGAVIYRLNKWHFSANYVYGSGFPDLLDNLTQNDYQRLDIALNRAFSLKKLNINAGFSILNLLNHQNIKYDNFYRLEDEEGEVTLHAEAVPFTPTIYFNLSF
ncbi:MAG: TonB-dependent receptor, partial [Prolixibacteraceae bacterium]|nr:TonB-dependent receptor [Prolixibacteraceae bacterium]